MKRLTVKSFIASFTLFICGIASLGQQPASGENIPRGWKEINARGLFVFYLPQSAWDTGFSGTEDFYKEYRISKLRFMFVYNPTSILSYDRRGQAFGRGFQEHVTEIDGKKAYLFDYAQNERGRKRYYTDLYIGDFPNGDVKLWMQADSWRQTDLEIAKKIFRTVKFLQP